MDLYLLMLMINLILSVYYGFEINNSTNLYQALFQVLGYSETDILALVELTFYQDNKDIYTLSQEAVSIRRKKKRKRVGGLGVLGVEQLLQF